MGEVRTVGRIMAGWGTLDSRKEKQADHWLVRISSLFCHCKCLPSSCLSPFPFFLTHWLLFTLPSSENPFLSTLTEQFFLRHMDTLSHCRRVLSVQWLLLSLCLSMVMRGCLPTQAQNNILIACPICYTLCQTQNRSGNKKIVVEWLRESPF